MSKTSVSRDLTAILGDYEAYARTFLRIRTKKGTLEPFIFNTAQQILWREIKRQMAERRPVRIIVLKARQMGISTFSEGLTFWKTVTRPYVRSLVIAHDLDATIGLFEMSKLFYDELPEIVKPMRRIVNRRELIFENPDEKTRAQNPGLRSSFEVQTANNIAAGRGGTIHHLHASEISQWMEPELVVEALFPAIPDDPETSVILESTAHGAGDWFHTFWKLSVAGKTSYRAIFLPWYLMPEYRAEPSPEFGELDEEERDLLARFPFLTREQFEWRRRKIAEFEAAGEGAGAEIFRQEYPATPEEAFRAAGTPVFSHRLLRQAAQQVSPGVRYTAGQGTPRPDPRGDLVVWEEPEPGVSYTIGVDVSAGVERGDFSCVEVIRSDTTAQVAEWWGLIDPIALAPIVESIARWYNEAVVAIEINNQGIATQRALLQTYWNCYRWQYLDTQTNRYSTKLGWQTTISTKPVMISFMNHVLAQGRVVIRSSALLDEFLTYIKRTPWDSGRASPGCHDDRVMAFLIAVVVAHIEENAAAASSPWAASQTSETTNRASDDWKVRHGLPLPERVQDEVTDWRLL